MFRRKKNLLHRIISPSSPSRTHAQLWFFSFSFLLLPHAHPALSSPLPSLFFLLHRSLFPSTQSHSSPLSLSATPPNRTSPLSPLLATLLITSSTASPSNRQTEIRPSPTPYPPLSVAIFDPLENSQNSA
jgi:hypothetical protein